MKNWKKYLLSSLALSVCGAALADVPVIPRPVKDHSPHFGKPVTDGFIIYPATQVVAAQDLENEAAFLKEILSNLNEGEGNKQESKIVLSLDPSLKKEGYDLKITNKEITIKGGSAAGVFYGIQTLKQLLPPQVYIKGFGGKGSAYKIAPLEIKDEPAFPWRGAMLDVARHFRDKEFVKKFIDVMAVHKMNRLHWHLVDSEGWRLEIKKYPKLVEVAQSFPAVYPGEDPTDKSRPARFMYGHFHGGGYYTQEDVKEIVAYAKARHIEIMPEIEFPGHSMAALTAYPEFGTTGKVPTVRSNISPDLIGVNEKALGFLKDVLDETMELFPFEVIHFGGDESPKGQWKESEEAQAKIKELGITGEKPEDQLQTWMFNEMVAYVGKKGRRAAGWEEIMHGKNIESLAKGSIVWAWLSGQNAVKAANNGFGAVHVQVGPFYLDSWQTNSPADNWTLYGGPFTLKSIYNFNLLPDGLTEEGKKNIYGAQGQLWAELMPYAENVEYQAYPRLCALAELTWTNQERKDYDDFYERLLIHTERLDGLNVAYRYVDPLPASTWDKDLLKSSTVEVRVEIPAVVLMARIMREVDAVADFNYTGGAEALNVKKVELLIGGKVVASDEHDGVIGAKKEDGTYKFKIDRSKIDRAIKPKEKKDVFGRSHRYFDATLRIVHDNAEKAENSQGNITFYTNPRGVELFNPRNFAGGDYPSATWNGSDFVKGIADVRIPMDGLVKEAGNYELVFSTKQDKVDALFGDVKIQGTTENGSASGQTIGLKDGAKIGFLPLAIKESDVVHGNSITFKVKGKSPFAGEVRVRLSKALDGVSEGIYEWNPKVFEGGRVASYISGVKPKQNGLMKISFNHKKGGNGLDINGVQIVKDGVVIVESKQKGFAGNNSKDNVYELVSPDIKSGQSYDIRLSISGSGGNDAYGQIAVE